MVILNRLIFVELAGYLLQSKGTGREQHSAQHG